MEAVRYSKTGVIVDPKAMEIDRPYWFVLDGLQCCVCKRVNGDLEYYHVMTNAPPPVIAAKGGA